MRTLDDSRLTDPVADRVRRSVSAAIDELQRMKAAATDVIQNQTLPSGVVVLVPHKLGRAPLIVLVSPPRGPLTPGMVEEIVDVATGNPDRAKYVALRASGMGATVVVDVEVK